MIRAQGLHKAFGHIQAVRGLDLHVARGEVVGLLGPNGAGKTTTLRLLSTFLQPDQGTVRIAGIDALADPVKARSHLGYLPEGAPLYDDLSVREHLVHAAALRGLDEGQTRAALTRAAERFDLGQMAGRRVGVLSKGWRQRVGLAVALLHEPQVVLLDEPTTGLDPNQVAGIRTLIRELAADRAVVLSTHVLTEVQATCDRVVIVAGGRVRAAGTPEQLRIEHGADDLEQVFRKVTTGEQP